jgi:hypothetical protein
MKPTKAMIDHATLVVAFDWDKPNQAFKVAACRAMLIEWGIAQPEKVPKIQGKARLTPGPGAQHTLCKNTKILR